MEGAWVPEHRGATTPQWLSNSSPCTGERETPTLFMSQLIVIFVFTVKYGVPPKRRPSRTIALLCVLEQKLI